MKISSKLLIIVLLTAAEVGVTIWAALEIAKGAKFHQLNFLHLKYVLEFRTLADKIGQHSTVDTAALRKALEMVRKQPLECLEQINTVDKLIMRTIDTDVAIRLCAKDIDDANTALMQLGQFENSQINVPELKRAMEYASLQFRSNSAQFEIPIEKTVNFMISTLIPFILFISIFNIVFITYLSRTITRSINRVITLLSDTSVIDKNFDEQLTQSASGELLELLQVAKMRIKKDVLNIRTSRELKNIVDDQTQLLTRANDELAQFAYRASHDLKSPITSSLALIRFIEEDMRAGNLKEAENNLGKTHSQLEKLETLVVDILLLAKADLDKNNEVDIEFTEVLSDISERLKMQAEQNNCAIKLAIEEKIQFQCEKARITQVLENILSNGIKYSDPNKDQRYVKVSISQKERLSIEIEDNGLGIPSVHWPHVFEQFKRFHPKISSGSGLGMAIVKKHVDALNGNIAFTSSTSGTTFTIDI